MVSSGYLALMFQMNVSSETQVARHSILLSEPRNNITLCVCGLNEMQEDTVYWTEEVDIQIGVQYGKETVRRRSSESGAAHICNNEWCVVAMKVRRILCI